MTTCSDVSPRLNASPSEMASDLNQYFLSLGRTSLQSVGFKYVGSTGQKSVIRVCTEDVGGGANYNALGFVGDTTQTADDKANAFFAAQLDFRADIVLDVSSSYRRSTLRDAMIVVGIPNRRISTYLNRQAAIVSPHANIAVGATGYCVVYGASGDISADVLVRNRGNAIWNAGELGWVAPDPVSGDWEGFDSCC